MLSDKHVPNTRPATLLKRLAAFVYDGFTIFSLILLATAIALIINHGQSFSEHQFLFLSYLFVIVGGFVTWFWQKSGQTLGMLAWRIRVIDQTGLPLHWKKAWLRFIVAIPSVLCFGIGWLWCLCDKDKQSLHDRICRTKVIVK